MIRLRCLAVAVTVAAMAGCNNNPEPEVVGGVPDDQADALANAAPVNLPPMIVSSMGYRCKDNSLVYVTFFNDNKTANLRQTQDGPPTALTAPEAGQPYTGSGYTVTGKPGDKTITIAGGGKAPEDCKAA